MCCPAKQARASSLTLPKQACSAPNSSGTTEEDRSGITLAPHRQLYCYSGAKTGNSGAITPTKSYSTSLTSSAAFFQSMRMTKAEKERDCKEMQTIIPTHRPAKDGNEL